MFKNFMNSLEFNDRIIIENFKSLKGEYIFEIRPLTILVGPNNSGKSSITKAIDLLKFIRLQNFDNHSKLFEYNFDNIDFKNKFGSLAHLLHTGEKYFKVGLIKSGFAFNICFNAEKILYYEIGAFENNSYEIFGRVYLSHKEILSNKFWDFDRSDGKGISNVINANLKNEKERELYKKLKLIDDKWLTEFENNKKNSILNQISKESELKYTLAKGLVDILKEAYLSPINSELLCSIFEQKFTTHRESHHQIISTFKPNDEFVYGDIQEFKKSLVKSIDACEYSLDELVTFLIMETTNYITIMFLFKFANKIEVDKLETNFKYKSKYLHYLNIILGEIDVFSDETNYNMLANGSLQICEKIYNIVEEEKPKGKKEEDDLVSRLDLSKMIKEVDSNGFYYKTFDFSHLDINRFTSERGILEVFNLFKPKYANLKSAEIDWDEIYKSILNSDEIEIEKDDLTDFLGKAKIELAPKRTIKKLIKKNFPKMSISNINKLTEIVHFRYEQLDFVEYEDNIVNDEYTIRYEKDEESLKYINNRFEKQDEFDIGSIKEEYKSHVSLINESLTRWQNTINARSANLSAKKYFDVAETSPFNSLIKDYSKLNKENQIDIINNVNSWLLKFGIGDKFEIKFNNEQETYNLFITDSVTNTIRKHNEFGAGVSQALQLIMFVLIAQKFNNHLIVEEPELYLHPSLQSNLGELFFNFVSVAVKEVLDDETKQISTWVENSFGSVIIETHSEYLVRKIQTLIAKDKGKLKDGVIIYYLNGPNASERCYAIKITDKGPLSRSFGPGFFDEASNLALALYNYSNN